MYNKTPNVNMYNRSHSNAQDDKQDWVIINGRRISYNGSIDGSKIAQEAGQYPGRRVVKVGNGQVETINPHKTYSAYELKDKYGASVKIKTMPERTKGNSLFGGIRSHASKTLITEQVFDIVRNFSKQGLDFDEHNADWVVFPKFRLPSNWHYRTAPLMIIFPTDYPIVPPIGFYMPSEYESPHGHKFNRAYHDAHEGPLQNGWDWYCCTVNNGAWRPAPAHASGGWRSGDSLWEYMKLISEVLGNDGD